MQRLSEYEWRRWLRYLRVLPAVRPHSSIERVPWGSSLELVGQRHLWIQNYQVVWRVEGPKVLLMVSVGHGSAYEGVSQV